MKKYFTLLFLFLMIHSFGQFTLNLGKNIYHKALIELEDGTEKSGFVLSF